ncbi:MAG: DUF4129 domain-containing protein [Anaerolineae bacterium]|nr:DUF4129 domain-containing protein [Anaerolineae bacterium]
MIFFRFIGWIINRLGWYTCLAWLLLATAHISLAQTLAEAIRDLDSGLLLPMALLGLLLGWGLAVSKRLPGWLAAALLFVLGVELALLRVGRLEGSVLTLGQNLVDVMTQVWPSPWAAWPSLVAVGQTLSNAGQTVGVVLSRLWVWVVSIITGNPAYDPVAVALVWSIMLWCVSSWAGWAVRRWGRPLTAMIPSAFFLAATLAYYPRNVTGLLVMLGATLLLIGLTRHRVREQRWQAKGIDYSNDIRTDTAFAVVVITIGLLSVASLVPSVSLRQVARRFIAPARISQPLAESLGVRREVVASSRALEPYRRAGLPQAHLVGSGPELSEQIVLRITLEPDAPEMARPRYRWRSLTYDRYTGRGWQTGVTQPFPYEAGQPTLETLPPYRRVLRQNVQVVGPRDGRVYVAGDLLTSDQPYQIEWRGPGDPFGIIIKADRYQADGLVSNASEDSLRTAGTAYPDGIARRHLSLPQTIPPRVLTLARDLTVDAPTPYDRAKAIETYLRRFPYTLDLPTPPRQRDLVDYFLFDLQQGYCDYYASAMVVLARAAGLPARLAVGYATGSYDDANAQYIVTEADAHSWPEIYFPNYGWIAFEPTAAQPISKNPPEVTAPLSPTETAALDPEPGYLYGGTYMRWGLFAIGGVLLSAIVGAAWVAIDGWWLGRLAPSLAITVLFDRLQRQGQRLAIAHQPGDTPFEFAAALEQTITGVAKSTRWEPVLSNAAAEVAWLTQLYVRTLYSTHPPQRSDQRQAIALWQRLRRRLWVGWFVRWWDRWRGG